MMDSSGCCIPGLSVNGPRCGLTLRGVRKNKRENCNPSLPYEVTGIFGFRFQFEVGPVTRILG